MSQTVRARDLLTYGLMGCAMGAVVVPIYIQVPYLYSRVYEVPSATVGAILLLSRLVDAVLDPAIGLWVDKRQGPGNSNRYALPILLAIPLLLLGMAGVFFPQGNEPAHYALSLLVSLLVVHLGFSLSMIAYQAWGSELGSTDKERSTFVAAREGIGIVGVIFAVSFSLESHAIGIYTAFALILLAGAYTLFKLAPRPGSNNAVAPPATAALNAAGLKKLVAELLHPLKHTNFRWLLTVFLCNGLAGALPATLVPFFMRDRLGLGESDQWVLAVYFVVGAASTVFWVWLAGRVGLIRSWMLSMVITVPTFLTVVALQEGDLTGYLMICVVSGLALGADLAIPAALVARLINDNQERGKNEGTYFGLWNWMSKMNLALAPTLALGTLQWFNYDPTLSKTEAFKTMGLLNQLANDPLVWVYAIAPCALKLLAVALLLASGLDRQLTKPGSDYPSSNSAEQGKAA